MDVNQSKKFMFMCLFSPSDTFLGVQKLTWSGWRSGSGGVKSTGVSQSVRETSRDESQNVLSTQKLFKTRDLELPIFEGSLPSCSPHSAGYTRTSVHPYFPVAKSGLNGVSDRETFERQICLEIKAYKSPIPQRRKLLAQCTFFDDS